MLLNRNTNGYDFGIDHCFALEKLVIEWHFTIALALAEIDGLSQAQAASIRNGARREDVMEAATISL
jgi:hypothetical protein